MFINSLMAGSSRGVIIALATTALVSGGAPEITSLSVTSFKDTGTGIEVNGTGFKSTQGNGKVVVETQGENRIDRITANQTITAWGDTQITFTCLLPSKGGTKWPGYYDLKVIDDTGAISNIIRVLIGPNQTTVASQNSAGFVEITTVAELNSLPLAETGAKAFLITVDLPNAELLDANTDSGMIFIFKVDAGGAHGAIEVTTGWSVNGSKWDRTDRTESDGASSATDQHIFTWEPDEESTRLYIEDTDGRIHRCRRKLTAAAVDTTVAAISMPNNPIETFNDEYYVKIDKDTVTMDDSEGDTGEQIRLSGLSAVGGITLSGMYTIILNDDDFIWVWHDVQATSSATGGGASGLMDFKFEFAFITGTDTATIGFDPAGSKISKMWWGDKRGFCVGNTGKDDIVIRGAGTPSDTSKRAPLRFYGQKINDGIIKSNGGDDWHVGSLNIFHNHMSGVEFSGNFGTGGECWDNIFEWCSQNGILTSSGDTSEPRDGISVMRNFVRFCGHGHKSAAVGGGAIKMIRQRDYKISENIIEWNWGVGFWTDAQCEGQAAGRGFFKNYLAHNSGGAVLHELSLEYRHENNIHKLNGADLRTSTTSEWKRGYFRAGGTDIYSSESGGLVSAPCIIDKNYLEILDGINTGVGVTDFGPVNSIICNLGPRSIANQVGDYHTMTNNKILIESVVKGTPRFGVASAGSDSGDQSEINDMLAHYVQTGNVIKTMASASLDFFVTCVLFDEALSKDETEFEALFGAFDLEGGMSQANFDAEKVLWNPIVAGNIYGKTPDWDDARTAT